MIIDWRIGGFTHISLFSIEVTMNCIDLYGALKVAVFTFSFHSLIVEIISLKEII